MDDQIIYKLTWPQIKGEVCLKLETPITDYKIINKIIADNQPLKLIQYAGNKWMDFVIIADIYKYIISSKLIDLLINNNITGWKTFEVELERKDLKYFGFLVTGESGAVIRETTPGHYKGISIDMSIWDGSDIFRPQGSGLMICNEKVKEVFERNKITNMGFLDIREFRYFNSEKYGNARF